MVTSLESRPMSFYEIKCWRTSTGLHGVISQKIVIYHRHLCENLKPKFY
jgi:hypothetical protein